MSVAVESNLSAAPSLYKMLSGCLVLEIKQTEHRAIVFTTEPVSVFTTVFVGQSVLFVTAV